MANIIALARTPIAPILGPLSSTSAVKLGSVTLAAALNNHYVPFDAVDHLIHSQCLTAGCGPFPQRKIAQLAGLHNNINSYQVNQQCTSGLQAACIASDLITLQKSDLVALVGTENVSHSPFLLRNSRCLGHGIGDISLVDSLQHDGPEGYDQMIQESQHSHGITKSDLDTYTFESFHRTASCYSDGVMQNEIIPITIDVAPRERRGGGPWISPTSVKVTEDLHYKTFVPGQKRCTNLTYKAPLSDGAASLVLASSHFIAKNSLAPIARILAYSQVTVSGDKFPDALVLAIKRLFSETKVPNVHLFDILDQHAIIPLVAMKQLNLDSTRVNINGNALSLGHVLGSSGIRQLISLVTALKCQQLQFGCAAAVNANGNATAILVESLN